MRGRNTSESGQGDSVPHLFSGDCRHGCLVLSRTHLPKARSARPRAWVGRAVSLLSLPPNRSAESARSGDRRKIAPRPSATLSTPEPLRERPVGPTRSARDSRPSAHHPRAQPPRDPLRSDSRLRLQPNPQPWSCPLTWLLAGARAPRRPGPGGPIAAPRPVRAPRALTGQQGRLGKRRSSPRPRNAPGGPAPVGRPAARPE